MNVELEPKVETMENIAAPHVTKIKLAEPTTSQSCCNSSHARDSWRYQVALVLSVTVLTGLLLYGAFGKLL